MLKDEHLPFVLARDTMLFLNFFLPLRREDARLFLRRAVSFLQKERLVPSAHIQGGTHPGRFLEWTGHPVLLLAILFFPSSDLIRVSVLRAGDRVKRREKRVVLKFTNIFTVVFISFLTRTTSTCLLVDKLIPLFVGRESMS